MQLRPLAWDTETCLIGPALLAPPLVCLTWQFDGGNPQIADSRDARALMRRWLEDESILFVGHNVAFDFAVICEEFPELRPLVWDAYANDRVADTQIRQQLLDVAAGIYRGTVEKDGRRVVLEYSLEALAKRCAGILLKKDAWRLSYSNFRNVPILLWEDRAAEVQRAARVKLRALEELPHGGKSKNEKERKKEIELLRSMVEDAPGQCIAYPLDDARATLAVYKAQEKHAKYLADQFRQTRAAWWLHLASAWGLRTDKEGAERLLVATQEEFDALTAELVEAGLVRPDGTRDTKAAKQRMIAVCREARRPVIRTDAHFVADAKCGGRADCEEHICLDADACERSEDELLIAYATRTTLGKQLSNDLPALASGSHYPIQTRYGFAATGRTTSSKPNIQNQSTRPGYREAFIPRPGWVFAQADYPTLELYCLAQCCVSWLGHSKLAEALNAGIDPHLLFAASMLRISFEEAKRALKDPSHPRHEEVKKGRKLAKAANFGFPGGMGIRSFVTTTRKGMEREEFEALGLDEARAKTLKDEWFAAWPEMPHYFARINSLCDEDSRATVETLFTKRIRGNVSYCSAANNGFQALGSDCAKNAGWLLSRRLYIDPTSPLFNARIVAFIHDEFVLEVKDNARAHDSAQELAAVMVEGANVYLPDVPIPLTKMSPLLMRRWSKKAEPIFDEEGRLTPWQ